MANILRNTISRSGRSLSSLHRARPASDPAAFDRYTTIWTFFRTQSTYASSPRAPPLFTPRRTELSLRIYATRSTFRSFSSSPFSGSAGQPNVPPKPPQNPKEERPPDTQHGTSHSNFDSSRLENYPKLFRRLALSLPHLDRHTRDDFLNAATGFWERLRIRFKWLTIRSFRKYNADDISAFVTWFFMSQTLWLLVGTYVSLLCRVVNVPHWRLISLQNHVLLCGIRYCEQSSAAMYVFGSELLPCCTYIICSACCSCH